MSDASSPTPLLDDIPAEASRLQSGFAMAALYVLSLGGAVLLSGALVAITGNSWLTVFDALIEGAFLAPGRWGDTLVVAAPMLLVALGMVIAVKAGYFNIGQEGQLLMGALAMAWVGTKLPGPGPVLLLFGLALAFAVGGAYAGIAAEMRNRRGVPEVISTLLLVFIALQIAGFAVVTDWLLRDLDNTRPSRAVSTAALPEAIRLPVIRIFGNEFNIGILIALATAALVAIVLARTVWGFRLRLLGHSPNVAQATGIAAVRTGFMAMFLSGGLAGLAGAVMLAGGSSGFRVITGFSQDYGWQGLLVALLARIRPLLAIPMAIVFAALRTGSGFLAATGVDRQIVDVVQALLVLALLIPPAIEFILVRRRAVARAGQEA
jgi:simple sugar transport system permease protein